MKSKCMVSLTILGLVACSSITEPDRDVTAPLQTDRLSYSFTRDDSLGEGFFTTPTIQVVVTNTSGATAFLTRGGRRLALVLQGLENGEWVTKYDKSIGDGGGVVRLEPGESHTFEDTISGVLPGTCECQPIIAFEDGVYRFIIADGYVDFYEDEFGETGDELPTEFRISNRFFLDAPG